MNFHVFISGLVLISLNEGFCLYLCLSQKQEAAWPRSNGVKTLDVLIMFALWLSCRSFSAPHMTLLSPASFVLLSLFSPKAMLDCTSPHIPPKSWNLWIPVIDQVMPLGLLHWRVLLWLIENELPVFTAFITKSVQMFISSVLDLPSAFSSSKVCSFHWVKAVNEYSS